MKKGISILLTLLIVLFCIPCSAFAEEPGKADAGTPVTETEEETDEGDVTKAGDLYHFRPVAAFTDEVYSDIPESAWYRSAVATAYELNLMVGSQGQFNPKGMVTAAETYTIAAKIHSIYYTSNSEFVSSEPWYETYTSYCLENGIISKRPENYRQPLSRSEFAAILSRTLPKFELAPIRTVADDQIPDVKKSDPNGAEIYRLYRAGVLSGIDKYGEFRPSSAIQRSEVAAILTRMVDPSQRSQTLLEEKPKQTYPDLTAKPSKGNSYFSTSAMVGNSLVQGMMLFSGLRNTMDFYCYQGVTVSSAGSYVSSLCAHKYDRVYIQLGINEIYMDTAAFSAAYGRIIDQIRRSLPNAEIYVMAITPVTQTVSNRGSFTMSRIKTMNATLYALAKQKNCWYLDSCTLLCDSSGYLPYSYAGWDGSPHLSTEGYVAWENIIRTHYA